MISIIICHRNIKLLEHLKRNIAATIGLPYEIIIVDNTQSHSSICEAYNEGARRSKFEHLCFTHEDIVFHTLDWGEVIVDVLSEDTIGLAGVIGSQYKPLTVSAWWDTHGNTYRGQVIHQGNTKPIQHCYNPKGEQIAEVVSLDGLFMATKKHVWQENSYDAERFTSFHFYDIDFATAIGQRYRVVVTYNIAIEHLSGGTINQDWFRGAVAFHQKWRKKLPLHTKGLRISDRIKSEILAAGRIIKRCQRHHYSFSKIFSSTLAYGQVYPVVILFLGWIFYFTRLRNHDD